jgi:hypothetical protein
VRGYPPRYLPRMKIDGTLTIVTSFTSPDEATARNDAARMLLSIALGVLQDETGDSIPGGAWVLALMPEVPE